MRKILFILIITLLVAKPIIASAEEIIPVIETVTDDTVLLTDINAETETVIYVNNFTEEEKVILLDSIQTIRAILVFIVFCLVLVAIIKFLSWFF